MKRTHKTRERGIAVLVTAIILVTVVPVMGLMFDGTLLFIIKAQLQGAVDGAALAGARSLARGGDSAAQISAAQTAASNYVKLNYPTNFFFSSSPTIPTPTVDLSAQHQRTVTVTATVNFPGLFLQYMTGSTTVKAVASATRRDVNVVMTVDRSGSLQASGSCTPLKAAAINFVGQFASGRDQVGLVTFASSTYANFPIANTFSTASPNVAAMINSIVCQGSTSTAQGLWAAYQQLAGLNQPGAFNVILLFTDGQPTGITVDMPIVPGSGCSQYTAGNPTGADAYTLANNVSKGYIRGVYNTYMNVSQFFGILDPNGYPGSGGYQNVTNGDINAAPNSNGCAYYSGWYGNMGTTSDFAGVPVKDIYGNSANTTYQSVTLNSYGLIDIHNSSNAQAMTLNTADSAATNIRNGVNDPVTNKSLANITIFSIGLGNAAIPASPTFLTRVSNDPTSPIYDSSKPAGKYIYAATTADLQPAFSEVASEILRIAK